MIVSLLFYILKWVSIQEDHQLVSAWMLYKKMYLFFAFLKGCFRKLERNMCVLLLVNIDCGQQYNVACFSMTPLRKENGGKTKGREGEEED